LDAWSGGVVPGGEGDGEIADGKEGGEGKEGNFRGGAAFEKKKKTFRKNLTALDTM
jgi:hypothetical protein